ncbi:MAG: hypothetical protein LC749_22040, partial [Actinobacteria bacterium]|nr:hypothetical protein [Actinomycetota bacterium]
MADELMAWHFVREDKRLGYGDGRKIRKGATFAVADGGGKPKLELCQHGLHGTVIQGDDKAVATHRTVIAWADATKTLHEFACDEAEGALRLAKVTDPRSWKAIEIKRLWLIGKANDQELAAAWDAAWDAARAAAWAAARAAAWDAARDAARDAAWAAARAAAWD